MVDITFQWVIKMALIFGEHQMDKTAEMMSEILADLGIELIYDNILDEQVSSLSH